MYVQNNCGVNASRKSIMQVCSANMLRKMVYIDILSGLKRVATVQWESGYIWLASLLSVETFNKSGSCPFWSTHSEEFGANGVHRGSGEILRELKCA